jgi:hypothetical protein
VGRSQSAFVLDLVGTLDHLSLVESAARLAEAHGARAHRPQFYRALRRAGWR